MHGNGSDNGAGLSNEGDSSGTFAKSADEAAGTNGIEDTANHHHLLPSPGQPPQGMPRCGADESERGDVGIDTSMMPEVLLQAAWREQRRDPTVALALAEVARRRARAGGAPAELHQRTAFLCGKILTEAYCDFHAGAALLAEAVAAQPDGWPGRQVGTGPPRGICD